MTVSLLVGAAELCAENAKIPKNRENSGYALQKCDYLGNQTSDRSRTNTVQPLLNSSKTSWTFFLLSHVPISDAPPPQKVSFKMARKRVSP